MAIDFIVPADIEAWEAAWKTGHTSYIGDKGVKPIEAVGHILRSESKTVLAYGPDILGRVLLHRHGHRVLVRHSFRHGYHLCEFLQLGPIGSRPAHPPVGDGYRY